MRYRRRVNRNIILVILASFVFIILAVFVQKAYFKSVEARNQRIIDEAISQLKYRQLSIDHDLSLMYPLLDLNHLTDSQLSKIYMLICTFYYNKDDMKSYFVIVGNALFYSERGHDFGHAAYLYTIMARHFLTIGADSTAYSLVSKATKYGSFYDVENLITRIHLLMNFSRYLISINNFDEAERAVNQILADAPKTASFSDIFPPLFEKSGNAIRPLILLAQGKTDEAYELACEVYEKYKDDNELLSNYLAFDFYMPILYVKTMWAIQHKKYDMAIEFNREYTAYCNKYNFIVKKQQLSGLLRSVLPDTMQKEKEKLSKELSEGSEKLSRAMLGEYAFFANEKFSTVMEQLSLKTEISERVQSNLCIGAICVFVLIMLLLIFNTIYSESQLDGLTKLSNRKSMIAKIRRLELLKKSYSVIMLDIDNFKSLNDSYGHMFGDEVLKGIADIVLDHEHKHIKAYRYGGEEIAIIFEQANIEDVIRHAESIRSKICRTKWSQTVRVSASFGIGTKPANPIKQADENLYYAKSKGKNITAYKINDVRYLAERRLEIRNPMPNTPLELLIKK